MDDSAAWSDHRPVYGWIRPPVYGALLAGCDAANSWWGGAGGLAWYHQWHRQYQLARRHGDRSPALSHNRSRRNHQCAAGAVQWDAGREQLLRADRRIYPGHGRLLS